MSEVSSTDVEAELQSRLGKLSLEQKVRLLTGADIWTLYPEPAIGLRAVVTSDGPAGVRGMSWDERNPSANVPSPTSLAATWDEERVERVGRLLASEARRKGVDVLLAPTVNLHRTPYGGRHFENLSEDPLLTSRIGTAYVRGVQAGGVAATVKHYVANDSETERFTVNAIVDERTLRELYLAPFEAIIRDARAWAVMAAYNSVNGPTMTENPLQRDVLKQEWGFDGVIMSDWYAARTLAAAGPELLDLIMPGPRGPWGDALVTAVQAGEIPESSIDDKVLRILRLAARVGALEGIDAAVEQPPLWTDAAISAELRDAAAAGFVLTRNSVLPLDSTALGSIAILGPNAAVARTLGGGSATVFPPYVISPLDGLTEALGSDVTVTHAAGVSISDRIPPARPEWLTLPDGSGPGVEVSFFGTGEEPLGHQIRQIASFFWWGPIEEGLSVPDVSSVRVRTRLRVPESGTYRLAATGIGRFQLFVDDAAVVDTVSVLAEPSTDAPLFDKPPQESVTIELSVDTDVAIEMRFVRRQPGSGAGEFEVNMIGCQLNVAPAFDEQAEFDRAVAAAASSDVAIVVVGTTEEVESEGFDRRTLALPGRQDELVRAVAAANPRTVVVVNSGAPVLLPWADDVAAVLLSWFPGQEFGHALADVLLGRTEPSGRLPTTWPVTEDHLPSVKPVDGTLVYDEGRFIGYRSPARAALFPFGSGLGYTTWEYVSLDAPRSGGTGDDVAVTVTVRNTGDRRGRTVAQAYLGRPGSAVERPATWLAGFATIDADPGEEVSATITIVPRAFEHWDANGWTTEPGTFTLSVGPSVADTPLAADLSV